MSEETAGGSKSGRFAYMAVFPGSGNPESGSGTVLESDTEQYIDKVETLEWTEALNMKAVSSISAREETPAVTEGRSNRLRLTALLAWSGVAGFGGTALLIRGVSILGTQFLELMGVWGVVSAILWILPAKLNR